MTIATLKQSMDRRFTRLERHLRRQFVGVDEKFQAIDQRFEAIDQRFEAADRRLEAVDRRLEAVDTQFHDLESRLTARIERRFDVVSDKLDTIAKILSGQQKDDRQLLHEHEARIQDIEAYVRSTSSRS